MGATDGVLLTKFCNIGGGIVAGSNSGALEETITWDLK
jgi:hypothetical protein